MKLFSQTRGVAGPRFRPRPECSQPTFGGGLWLGRQPGPHVGPQPSLALNFGPSLRGYSKIPKAFEHFVSNLSVLEAVWTLQKQFKGSRIGCICKGCCSWFPEWFEVLGEDPRGGAGVWGQSTLTALGGSGKWNSGLCELPTFYPRTPLVKAPSPSGHLLF